MLPILGRQGNPILLKLWAEGRKLNGKKFDFISKKRFFIGKIERIEVFILSVFDYDARLLEDLFRLIRVALIYNEI